MDAVRARVMSQCATAEGCELCRQMSFSSVYEEIRRSLSLTAEMLSIVTGDEDIPIGRVKDIGPAVGGLRVPGTYLSTAELVDVRSTLEAIDEISTFFKARSGEAEGSPSACTVPGLCTLAATLLPLPGCHSAINRVIDRYGNVKDNASPELADIRRQLSSLQSTLSSTMRRVVQQAVQAGYIEADASPAMRDDRLVIPVAPMHKRKINGIVHDESASGKTVFIEPAEIVEQNNRIRELQSAERREIVRCLIAVANELRPEIHNLRDTLATLGEIDFIHAKALYARDIDAQMPQLSPTPGLEWYHACHPVLLHSLRRQGKDIVPLDIMLSPERRILVISGPNAGGKSVCIKTVAIVQYMLQCGVLPPVYENSRMGVFDDLMIDIGDDQSIEDDLSTYSSHLRNMKAMLRGGRATSLTIVDEMGSGTEPTIGGAIAQAILKSFNEKGMWGVVTTHYQNLKTFADDTPGLVNGSMLYDRHMMHPLFKLSIGNPGSSFAVEIARKTGLPEEIIAEAESIVGSDYINLDKYLLDIARDKRYWERKRDSIRVKEKKIDATLERYEQSAEELRTRRREILDDARREAERLMESSNASIERAILDIRRSQAEKEATLQARRDVEEQRRRVRQTTDIADIHPLLKKVPKSSKRQNGDTPRRDRAGERQLTVGDVVKLEGQSTPGRIIDISGKKATVAFGMLKTQVAIDRLTPSNAKISSGSQTGSTVALQGDSRSRQLSFKTEIDVRGMRVDEALQAVTYFIDDAIQFNARRVRILHGTGTGALRQSLREYLSTVSGIEDYRDEDVRFGGAGITVVSLSD